MTAEIAVLNKSAVVLAADSAVTIGGGDGAKIYNSANKIFEIGSQNPIGLMVYNRLDYMDLPIEVLAKEYRRQRKAVDFASVEDCCRDFLSFLENEVAYNDKDEIQNLVVICFSVAERLLLQFDRALRDDVEKTGKILKSRFNSLLKGVLDKEIETLKKLDKADGYARVVLSEVEKSIAEDIFQRSFRTFRLNKTAIRLLRRLISLTIEKKAVSDIAMGLVFAGFGSGELCPTLIHLTTDGVLSGKLKTVTREIVDIGRQGAPAEIMGFAQDDMVQSFVNGVDPLYRQYSRHLLRQAIETSAKLVLAPILKNPTQTNSVLQGLADDFDDLTTDLEKRADSWVQKNFTDDVKDMVRSMPKEELANLAESLIEITSLKRKVTRDRETVGGEVDVAVISRSEGLVWVKRKHYFPPELNARFFDRRRGQVS